MADIKIVENAATLVRTAAEITVNELAAAITAYGQATWVMAGGTMPALVYHELAEYSADKLAWDKVSFIMGDERYVPVDHPDSNWRQARAALLSLLDPPSVNLLQPIVNVPLMEAAVDYEKTLLRLPQKLPGIPRLNHAWLGMGEDGHTLSLFPGEPAPKLSQPLVVAVRDAPKPPPNRISLTLHALEGVETCLIMVSGAGKADILARALAGDSSLPIVQAVNTIEAAGGKVTWLADAAAAPSR